MTRRSKSSKLIRLSSKNKLEKWGRESNLCKMSSGRLLRNWMMKAWRKNNSKNSDPKKTSRRKTLRKLLESRKRTLEDLENNFRARNNRWKSSRTKKSSRDRHCLPRYKKSKQPSNNCKLYLTKKRRIWLHSRKMSKNLSKCTLWIFWPKRKNFSRSGSNSKSWNWKWVTLTNLARLKKGKRKNSWKRSRNFKRNWPKPKKMPLWKKESWVMNLTSEKGQSESSPIQ